MKISQKGINFIKNYEGCRLKAYKCTSGVPTIGYGHTNKVLMGDEITQKEAEDLFKIDLIIHENNVNKLVKVPLTQNQFDALVSLEYNIGYGNFSNSTILRLLNQKKYKDAAEKFVYIDSKGKYQGWVYSARKVCAGLVNRRKAEQAIFLS